MSEDPAFFQTSHTMRAMRRLKPDAVADEVTRKVIAAATCAPSGMNSQR